MFDSVKKSKKKKKKSKGLKRAKFREAIAAYLFLLPNFLGFMVFVSLPVIAALVLSFFHYNILGEKTEPPKYAYLENYSQLLGFHSEETKYRVYQEGMTEDQYIIMSKSALEQFVEENGSESVKKKELYKEATIVPNDPLFWKSLYNTFFLMLIIPVSIAGSLILALMLNKKLPGRMIFRTIYFLPTFTAGVATYMVWSWIYNADYGLLNQMIKGFFTFFNIEGFKNIEWLNNYRLAKPSLMLVNLWATVGGTNMLLYLAGLQSIDPQLYEAADIDGASGWQKFWAITWPLLSPTTFFIGIMSIIMGLQGGFELVYILTPNGMPAHSTFLLSYYIFQAGFEWQEMGLASAMAYILFAVVLTFTLIAWKYGGKVVHYT